MRGLAAAAILLLLSISGMAQTSQPQPWPNTADEPLAFDYGASTGAQALIRSGDDILLRFIPDGHTIDVAPGAWLQANHVPQGFRLLAEPTPVAAWYDLPDIIAFDGSSASAVHTLGDNPDGQPTFRNGTSRTDIVPTSQGPRFAWFDFASETEVARTLWVATFAQETWSKVRVLDIARPARTVETLATTDQAGNVIVAYHVQTSFPDGAEIPHLLRLVGAQSEELPLPSTVVKIVAAPRGPSAGSDIEVLALDDGGAIRVLRQHQGTWTMGEALYTFPADSTGRQVHGASMRASLEGDLAVAFNAIHSGQPGLGGETLHWVFLNGAWSQYAPPGGSMTTAGDAWGESQDLFYRTRDWDGSAWVYGLERLRFTVGPTAAFSIPDATTTRTEVAPTNQATPGGAGLASWHWDFGDGESSTSHTPTHTFESPGTYWIRQEVVDGNGASDVSFRRLVVELVGPESCLETPGGGTTNSQLTLSDCSAHPESSLGATIESHAWNFGDGTTSTAQNPSHTYTSPGTYTITLTVTDEQGATDTATKSITVTNPPPNQKPAVSVSFTPESPIAGQEVTFTATASDNDGSITSTAWTVDGVGAGTSNSLTQTFTEPRIVSVAFTATDDDGASTTVTKSVNVQAPSAPEISLSQTQITDKSGQEFTIDVTVTNPNPVPVTVDLASDAPEAWSPTFEDDAIELAAGESTTATYTITPPYTVGGLTIIAIEASIGDATDSVILRAQFTVGEAPDTDDPVDDPVREADTKAEPVNNIQSTPSDSKSGMPMWAWFAGGGAVVLAGVGVTLAVVLRKP